MSAWILRLLTGVVGVVSAFVLTLAAAPPVFAACGAVSCFVVIGSQQQIPQKGLLTINGIYGYTPQQDLLPGTNGVIAEIDQARRRLLPNHHREIHTITQTYTADFNYGVTDRFGVELTVPFLNRTHKHTHWHGNPGHDEDLASFYDNGLGDIRLIAKYNLLPTLRSMVVTGFGVELPTGKWNSRDDANGVQESPVQLGRGQMGLLGSIYQTYELIPHRLNQFGYVQYRHTFMNNDGYQFGDEWMLNAGVNLVTVPWLVISNQINYRYNTHDTFSASLSGGPIRDLAVPNTGSTFLAYTPGLLVSVGETWQAYFYSQIPIARDFNNNLAQGTSFTFGVTKYFQLFGGGGSAGESPKN